MRTFVLGFSLLVLAGLVGTGAPVAGAAPRTSVPSLTVAPASATAVSGVAVGDSITIGGHGYDTSRPVSLYKAMWVDSGGFYGWNYQYYKGYNVNADGTFSVAETESQAGQFRFQACQYYDGKTKNPVCSAYVPLSVD
jgi:hypothetical protein